MKLYHKIITAVLICAVAIPALTAEEELSLFNTVGSEVQFFAEIETGATKVLHHTFQSGSTGTDFNFVTQGGQEILFPFQRIELGAELFDRHVVSALYQPLTVGTQVTFRGDVTIDATTFTSGTPMDLKYGFPFWRLTYGYDVLADPAMDLFVGAAIQFRNASIVFAQVDGAQATTNQNLGIVPALYSEFSYTWPSGISAEFEATGIYASSAFFNGADFDFSGSLLDSSLRLVLPLRYQASTYVGLRFIGGTAEGTSGYADRFWTQAQENYSKNFLATLNMTAGIRIR